jgi:Zn-dependent protease
VIPLLGSFKVGRWFGFPIRIDLSWFVLIVLIVWIFTTVEFPRQLPGYGDGAYLAMGIAAALFFFLSLLLHELAHSIVARSRGVHVQGITLFIFGGVAQTTMEAKRPVDEFLITVVGPLASLVLAAAFWALGALTAELYILAPAGQVSRYLGWLNFVLAAFNLLPGFPLDGGRIFRAAVWQVTGDLRRATRWATMGGRLLGYTLMAGGGFLILQGPFISGLWLAFIGWFLSNAAASSYRQFQMIRTIANVPVTRALRPTPAVAPQASVLELAELFVAGAASALPVVREGGLVGVVTLEDVAGVPNDGRAELTASELMIDLGEIRVVPPDTNLDEVVAWLQNSDGRPVIVAAQEVLHGILTLQDISDWVARARTLGLDRADPRRGGVGEYAEPIVRTEARREESRWTRHRDETHRDGRSGAGTRSDREVGHG